MVELDTASNIREKLRQSDRVVLDPTRTNFSPADSDNIINLCMGSS